METQLLIMENELRRILSKHFNDHSLIVDIAFDIALDIAFDLGLDRYILCKCWIFKTHIIFTFIFNTFYF